MLGPAWMIGGEIGMLLRRRVARQARERGGLSFWHLAQCAPVLVWVLGVCGMPFWLYVAAFIYPGASLAMLRSFAEHRAAPEPERRTAIVENARILGPLYLYNNLHVVHHVRGGLPWYRISEVLSLEPRRADHLQRRPRLSRLFDVARRYLLAPHHSRSIPTGRARRQTTRPRSSPRSDVRLCRGRVGEQCFLAGMAERLRAVGVDTPLGLTRSGEIEAEWRYPNLLFGQTCGYPYRKALQETVTLIATPEYAFPGCEGLTRRSCVIRRADDRRRSWSPFVDRSRRSTANSNSGMNLSAPSSIAMGASFFAKV